MMRHDFWNLWPEVISGREGDEDGANGDNSGGDGDEDEDLDEGDPNGDSNTNTDNAKSAKTDEDFANLERALAAERRQNKAKDRELRKLQAAQGQKQETENEDLETTKRSLQATQAKAEKLAAGLLKRDLESAITKAARDAKFIDVDDAINGIDRTDLVYDQDDEDPTDIDIDFDSVVKAVKALAAKKPHFLVKGTDDGEASGSPMGGSRRRTKKSDEDALREHYPSL